MATSWSAHVPTERRIRFFFEKKSETKPWHKRVQTLDHINTRATSTTVVLDHSKLNSKMDCSRHSSPRSLGTDFISGQAAAAAPAHADWLR